MIGQARSVRRGWGKLQQRFVRARPGSVLILVIALLVLMAMMGTAYISTARVDRSAAATNSFNTEIDLLVQGVVEMSKDKIIKDLADNFWPAASTTNYTDPKLTQTWISDRVPVLPQPIASTSSTDIGPGWSYISAAPIDGIQFESPYLDPANRGLAGVPGPLIYGTQRQNMVPSWVSVATSSGTSVYPALSFTDQSNNPHKYLAGDADGDGIADAALWRLPMGEINGVTYYAAVRIVDDNSAVNASVAWTNNASPANGQLWGDFFPTNVNLQGLAAADGQTGLNTLNQFRFNDTTSMPAPSLTPIADGSAGPPPTPPAARGDFSFASGYDAFWMQLGRRLGNPGWNTTSNKYQALPLTESATLAYRFCLANPFASPSIIEQALPMSLRTGAGNPAKPVRSSQYPADQVAAWFTDNFNYLSESSGTPLPRRALITGRNGIQNSAPNKYGQPTYDKTTQKRSWNASATFKFGDWVTGGSGKTYVCFRPNTNVDPDADNPPQYWAAEPWVNFPTKTSVNTATFPQLYLAFWNVMTDAGGSVNPLVAAAGAPSPDTANAAPGIFRSPIHFPQVAPPDPNQPTPSGNVVISPGDDIQAKINSSSPGDTISFTAGQFEVSSPLNFLSDRTYVGVAGSSGPAPLTPDEVMKLRAALAAVNTITLRDAAPSPAGVMPGGDVVSRLVDLGPVVGNAPGSGGTVLNSGGNQIVVDWPAHDVVVTGITFQGGGTKWNDTSNVTLNNCTFQNCQGAGVEFNNCTSLNVTGCKFLNMSGGGIVGWGPKNSHFDGNRFDTMGQDSMHLFFYDGPGNPGNNTVSGNVVTNYKVYGLGEFQYFANGLQITHNYTGPQGHDGYGAISCATGGRPDDPQSGQAGHTGLNIVVAYNTCVGTDTPGHLPNNAIEYMGNGSCHDNLCIGWQLAILYGLTAGGWSCTNNNCMGCGTIHQPENFWADNRAEYPNPDSGNAITSWGSVPATPPAPDPTTASSTTAGSEYYAMVYGAARQPYITEVYANNDPATSTGYVAVELYNPYDKPMALTNWQLASMPRPRDLGIPTSGATPISTTSGQWPPTIPAGGYVTLVSSSDPPPGKTAPTGTTIVIPELSTALDTDFIILRPRRADGTIGSSTDPSNPYDENQTADLVPVDSYDFSGLPFPADQTTGPVEWHYVRPNDPASKAWHFVYPGPYDGKASGGNPRFLWTKVGPFSANVLASFGQPDAALLTGGPDMPVQVANIGTPGPNPMAGGGNAFPFGGFARNGDMLHIPFIGAYRIQVPQVADAQHPANTLVPIIAELNNVTNDAMFAKDSLPNHEVELTDPTFGYNVQNIGHFAPCYPLDYGAGVGTPYSFAFKLFDYLTVLSPQDDYLPNLDPNAYPGPAPQPVANAKASVANANPPASGGAPLTEDTVPIEGLININTAPWPVLATLPMCDTATANTELAKAIAYYRSQNGPFHTIWELNKVAVNVAGGPSASWINNGGAVSFRTSLGQTGLNGFDPTNASQKTSQNGDLSTSAPGGTSSANDQVANDFESQNLALTRISNLITTRSDTYTVYVLVQGWRHAGTATPELVVQRRACYLADRTGITDTNKRLTVTNVPVN